MKIKKIKNDKLMAGVLAGFAYSFKIQTWIVRAGFIFLLLVTGILPAAIIYLVLASTMPEWEEDPSDYSEICK